MRSDVIKKGAPAAPNRSLLYALGYTKEELERPLIGVVCSHHIIYSQTTQVLSYNIYARDTRRSSLCAATT